jgi:hypothetical protein
MRGGIKSTYKSYNGDPNFNKIRQLEDEISANNRRLDDPFEQDKWVERKMNCEMLDEIDRLSGNRY